MTVRLYEVGGCIRDEIMGYKTKDVDFAVEADSFSEMREYMLREGFKIYLETEQFGTIRAGVPKGHSLRERTNDADFVLCRKDGPSSNGRHPDYVESGTIYDDLARRDFTINAIAKCVETGELIDPHNGIRHCESRILRFVGLPAKRIKEDGLRIIRGARFAVTKCLVVEYTTERTIFQADPSLLKSVAADRIRIELNKMFKHDTIAAMETLGRFSHEMQKAIFSNNLRLEATLKA